MAPIPPELFDDHPAARVTGPFLDLFDTAKGTQSKHTRILWRHPCGDISLGTQREVMAQFLLHIIFEFLLSKERDEAKARFTERAHLTLSVL